MRRFCKKWAEVPISQVRSVMGFTLPRMVVGYTAEFSPSHTELLMV